MIPFFVSLFFGIFIFAFIWYFSSDNAISSDEWLTRLIFWHLTFRKGDVLGETWQG